MNGIKTIGNGMSKLTKKQILTLEINALCVLTQNRAMNSTERKELREVSDEHRAMLPKLIMMEHILCDCFTKHVFN